MVSDSRELALIRAHLLVALDVLYRLDALAPQTS
jgi:hypothetical protein